MATWKILQVVASSHGGAAEVIRGLAQGVDPKQFQTTVILPDDGGQLRAPELKLYGCQVEYFKINQGFNLLEWYRLWRYIHQHHFNLIHAHGTRAALWVRLASLGGRRPKIVFTVHGLSTVHYGGLLRHLHLQLERLLQHLTDHTICVAESERTEMLRWGLASPYKTSVIRNGIVAPSLPVVLPPNLENRTHLEISPNAFVIVTICRLHKPRDFETLLRGFVEIKRQLPSAFLLIVGDGPLASHINQLCQQYELTTSVKSLGLRHDIDKILSSANLFVLLTAGWEGLPISILEAMRQGLPVVASQVGGIPEVVINDETGLLIPPQNIPAFVKAVMLLATDNVTADRLGGNGQKRVATLFTLQQMAQATMNIYWQMLQATG